MIFIIYEMEFYKRSERKKCLHFFKNAVRANMKKFLDQV